MSLGLAVVRSSGTGLDGTVTDLQSPAAPSTGAVLAGVPSTAGFPTVAGVPSVAGTPTVERRVLIAAAIATFRELPFHRVTMATVAARAAVSIDEVLAHFPTWDGLLLATLDRWNLSRMIPITPLLETHGTVWFLRGIVTATAADPAMSRFLLAMLNIAAVPDEPIAPMLLGRWADFHRLIQDNLAKDVELGREPSTMVPASGAEQLIAIYEGLQLQFLARPGLDLVASFDRAVTRLREGWRQSYIPPVWDIGSAA
jgi:AcrR family transcriptional regulator